MTDTKQAQGYPEDESYAAYLTWANVHVIGMGGIPFTEAEYNEVLADIKLAKGQPHGG